MLMRGLKDPRIGFTTITDVHVTGDLREATIYVSLFGSDKEKEDTLIALKHAAGHIRTELGKVLKLRHIPSITFDKDTSLDYSMHIESLLNEIKKDELDHVTIKNEVLRKYFPKSYTPKQMQDTIIRLLEKWQRSKQRDMER